MERLNLAVLVSGRGSNLQSIIDACARPGFPARIEIVISNKPDAYALTRAAQAGIKTAVLDHRQFASREAFEDALQQVLDAHPIDLICLAGFMRVLTAGFVGWWENRMINIHPSLLPKFKGLHTHQRAIEAGDAFSGCTIHYVTPDMDAGPIILQREVAIDANDTPESLAEKILAEEHIAYPQAIEIIADHMLKFGYSRSMIPSEEHAMDHHPHTPVSAADAAIDQDQIARAEQGWHAFTKYGKWFTLHVIAILILMAIFMT